MRRFNFATFLYKFSNNTLKPQDKNLPLEELSGLQKSSYGGLRSISAQKRKMSADAIKKYKENLPTMQLNIFASQHLCNVSLYMSHNEWKSQYIFALMNYQKIGFIQVSDYVFLNEAAKFYGIHKKPKSQQFPIMQFSIPLQQPYVLHGIKQIIQFLNGKQLFRFQVDDDEALAPTVQKYINDNIVPNLQAIFWHPRLTFQNVFHTNISSYNKSSMSYKIIGIFYRNLMGAFINMTKNLIKILKNKQTYANSRANLQKSFKEIVTTLNKKQFIGGNKPSHLDFYLYAIINTKMNSKNFQNFLRKDISGQFWAWVIRMRSLTQYDKDRITLI